MENNPAMYELRKTCSEPTLTRGVLELMVD